MTDKGAAKSVNQTSDNLAEIKSNMKLLEADLMGIKVDEEA
jgi:hypothetical protein